MVCNKYLLFLIGVFFSFVLTCQISGVKSEAMGGLKMAVEEEWSAFGTPANAASCENGSIALCAHNFYGIMELNELLMSFIIPTPETNLGLGIRYFGLATYSELDFAFTLAREFKRIAIGIRPKYLLRTSDVNAQTRAVALDAAINYQYTKRLLLSIMGSNINRDRYSDSNRESVGSEYMLASKYSHSDQVEVYSEIAHHLDFNRTTIKLGLSYLPNDYWAFHLGLSNVSGIFGIGAIYRKQNKSAGISFRYHQYLGLSPTVAISSILK
jgi:hypothetical protein